MKKLFSFIFILLTAPGFAQAEPHVRASLISKTDHIAPGKPFWVAVRLDMDQGWHTYYKNPGDSGLPTKISWKLPAGFEAGKIQWPKPKKITESAITNYIYEDRVDLAVRIAPPANLKEETVNLSAKVSWLECKDACVPGSSEVRLTLPVSKKP